MVISHKELVKVVVIYAMLAAGLDSVLRVNLFSQMALPLSFTVLLVACYFKLNRILKYRELYFVLGLVVLGCIYFVLSETSFYSAIGSIKDFFPSLFVFCTFLALRLPLNSTQDMIKLIHIFCLLQIPVSLCQVIIWEGLGDQIGGLFGYGGNQYLLFCMFCLNIISASYYLSGQITFKRYIFELVFSLIPVTLASTVFSYILIMLHLLIVLFVCRRDVKQLTTLSTAFLGFVFFMIGVAFVHDTLKEGGKVSSYFTSGGLEQVSSYGSGITKEGTYGRTNSIGISIKEICESNMCQGFGFGSSNVGETFESTGVIEFKHFMRKIGRTQLSFLLIEVGIVGTMLFLFLLLSIYNRASKLARVTNSITSLIPKITVLSLPALFIYQKPFNFVFSGFILMLFLALPFLTSGENGEKFNEY